jgi:hypothetical protein
VRGSFLDIFVVVCGIEQMLDDDAMTLFEVLCGLEQM